MVGLSIHSGQLLMRSLLLTRQAGQKQRCESNCMGWAFLKQFASQDWLTVAQLRPLIVAHQQLLSSLLGRGSSILRVYLRQPSPSESHQLQNPASASRGLRDGPILSYLA